MIIYNVILLLILFLIFRIKQEKEYSPFGTWTYSFVFITKVGVGILFILLYSYYYGNGQLNHDPNFFMTDSKILNQVFYKSPSAYFKLLFGIENSDQLTLTYLSDTTHWDSVESKLINDNRFVIRVHSLIHFISFGSSFIHLIIMCALSTIALKQFFISITNFSNANTKIILLSLLFLPSLLFWSSSILKEPFLFLGLALFLRFLFDVQLKKKRVFYLLISLPILLNIKPYVFIFLLFAIFSFGISKLIRNNKWTVIIILSLLISPFLFPNPFSKKVVSILTKKQTDFINVGKGGLHALAENQFYYFRPDQIKELSMDQDSVWITQPIDAIEIIKVKGQEVRTPVHLFPNNKKWYIHFKNESAKGLIDIPPINESRKQLFLNSPTAIFNALFRPLPNDPGSFLKYFAFLETLLLFSFLGYAIRKRKKLSQREKGILIANLVFILLLSTLIGLTTPVLGAIVRYRTPAYLGLLFTVFLLYSPKSSSE